MIARTHLSIRLQYIACLVFAYLGSDDIFYFFIYPVNNETLSKINIRLQANCFFKVLTKFQSVQKTLVKIPNIKFHENSSTWSRAIPCEESVCSHKEGRKDNLT